MGVSALDTRIQSLLALLDEDAQKVGSLTTKAANRRVNGDVAAFEGPPALAVSFEIRKTMVPRFTSGLDPSPPTIL
jgi:hypothetical protein